MATSKKIYITQDTEFADGVTITQNGKPIGGETGIPIKGITAQELTTKHLSDFYSEYPNQWVYYTVGITAPTGIGPSLLLKIQQRTSNNTYTIEGFGRHQSEVFTTIYKTGLTSNDIASLSLSSILTSAVSRRNNTYGTELASKYQALVRNTIGLAGVRQATLESEPEQHYSIQPAEELLFDENGTGVLSEQGQWITPRITYENIQRTTAQVAPDCELKQQDIDFELNFEEIVNYVLANHIDLQFSGYVISKYFGDEWTDIDGYTTWEKGNPEFDLVLNLKNSQISNDFVLFTYDQISGTFIFRNDAINKFSIISSMGSIYEKVSIAQGISPSDVKFYTKVVGSTIHSALNESHYIDITELINAAPCGTRLYKHELIGSINGSYGSGDIDIISGYIISTDSAPLSDITSLYRMLGLNGTCIGIRLQAYDYSSADSINIDRLIPGTSNTWLALSGGNYSAYQVYIQLELPTCSLTDTVTEL